MDSEAQVKLDEICEELDSLADLMADSEELRVHETPIVARLNELLETYARAGRPK